MRVQKGSPVSIVEKRKEKESDEAAPAGALGSPEHTWRALDGLVTWNSLYTR